MAVKYNVVQRRNPADPGAVRMFYASAQSAGDLTMDEIIRRIEYASSINGADVNAVVYSFTHVLVDGLSNGQIVRLGDVGSLRIGLSSEGKAAENEVGGECVKKARVIFTPSAKLKNMLLTLKYEKA